MSLKGHSTPAPTSRIQSEQSIKKQIIKVLTSDSRVNTKFYQSRYRAQVFIHTLIYHGSFYYPIHVSPVSWSQNINPGFCLRHNMLAQDALVD